MIQILLLTSLDTTLALKNALDAVTAAYGPILSLKKYYFKEYEAPDTSLQGIKSAIAEADIIVIDTRSDTRVSRSLPGLLAGASKTVVVLVGATAELFCLTRMGSFSGEAIFKNAGDKEFTIESYVKTKRFSGLTKMLGRLLPVGMLKDMRNWVLAQEYYGEGGEKNLQSLLLLLLKHYGGQKQITKVPPPEVMPGYGLASPDGAVYSDRPAYAAAMGHRPGFPLVAVLMHGGMYFRDSLPVIAALQERLQGRVNLLFIFSMVEHNLEALTAYCDGIELLVTLQYFRLWGGPYGGSPEATYAFLRERDVPLMIGLRAFETDRATWLASDRGINPIETTLGVMLPELDGAIEPLLVATLDSRDDEALGIVKAPGIIEERIDKLCSRMLRWLTLRRLPSADKKLAIITYSYPPGEASLASAGYLDVFASLTVFLEKLQARGYSVELPGQDLKSFFLENGIVNSPHYQNKQGIHIPAATYRSWFDELPLQARQAVIERWGEPPGDIMVDSGDLLLPGAIIGSVFLGVQPSRGVHENDEASYHDKALPPHHQYLAFYLFLEKSFGADAVVHFGMHGTLEFLQGKEAALSESCFPDLLIGTMPHLYYYWIGNPAEATIAKRRSAALCLSHASPVMKAAGLYEQYLLLEDLLAQQRESPSSENLQLIEQTAAGLHLPPEPGALGRELYKLKNRLIPYGLHVMDRRLGRDELADYLTGVLQFDREMPSIMKAVAAKNGLSWEAVKTGPQAEAVMAEARQAVAAVLDNRAPAWLAPQYIEAIQAMSANLDEAPLESDGLLRALEGRYILPARAGDPVRDPEVYPAGRGMYGFDPRLIPTLAARARGAAAAGKLISHYRKQHGRYPETLGAVLWGFETMKTGGDTIAMILDLLGVRLVHKKSLWVKDLELIPLAELGRPRIDVMVTICGIFRDTFAGHVEFLNRACALAAASAEPLEENFIRKHMLAAAGEGPAKDPVRIFGPAPTEYATELPTLIEKSTWEGEDELAKAFEGAMQYAYTGSGIAKNSEAFAAVAGTVEMVAQERDTVEYDITDLDHYYEFLGGLSQAAAAHRGEKVPVAVIDQTEAEPEVEELSTALERGTRSRTLNPQWLEGMLAHDFHGAKKIKDRVEYLLGFAATTGSVADWVFDSVADTLMLDPDMLKQLRDNNPYATSRIGEILIESNSRGYWQAAPERLQQVRDIVMDLESGLE